MADALASGLVKAVLGNLNSLVVNEIGAVWGFKSEIENVKRTFRTIQAVLQDAEEKQWKREAIKNWLIDLKDAAYDADDVLDEFAIEAARRQQHGVLTNQVRSFFSFDQNPLVFRVKMAHRLKDVREKLDAIAKERHNFQLMERVGDVEEDRFDWRLTSSIVNESEIYGRHKEKEGLINMLLANSDNLSVYAICGMGGLGKTTLAQLVYNDGRVEGHFDLRIWVCVSTDFDLRRLTSKIIESIDGSPCPIQELDPLQRHLQGKLSGRKALLVLDDVWDDCNSWNGLKDGLMSAANGSAVVVTTRNETVASKMGSAFVQRMEILSDNDSWFLFERFAFGTRRDERANLEKIGKAIVKKCGGVPLAVKTMGNLMRTKENESQWLSILENELWNFLDKASEFPSALRLSYINLPQVLKQCFAICSVFPKDYVMTKENLIALWISYGFISCKMQTDWYNIGEEIFSELVGRSFFQDVKEDDFGNVTCKMHDLMHDLALSITGHECCLIENNPSSEISKTIRHVTVNGMLANEDLVGEVKSLRSILYFNRGFDTSHLLHFLLRGQNHLRTVHLSGYIFSELPASLANSKHLMYLDVSGSYFENLPESISSLQNLQTLNLKKCKYLRMLPKGMRHLKNLLYLDLTGCYRLCGMPPGMGLLTSLRKLGVFIVGTNDGHRIGELRRLNYLGGELSIKGLENVSNLAGAKNANLIWKKDLRSLSLSWCELSNNDSNNEEVLCGLQPHSNLKKLEISGYGGSSFPSWMMSLLLPNLVEISLKHCGNCEHLPPFGKLKSLKYLDLYDMNRVKCIGNDLYRGGGEEGNPFPSLVRLKLHQMDSLVDWTTVSGRETFPRLAELDVSCCPVLSEIPIIPSIKRLKLEYCSATSLRSATNFTSLNSLNIKGFDQLALLPDGMLQNHRLLESLEISRMRSLKSLSNQLDNLSALKFLDLEGCRELECFPEQGLRNLNSLETLNIRGCHALISLPTNGLCGLSSLRGLSINRCQEFASLSDGVRYLTSLEALWLNDCPKLNTLPEGIQNLTSLSQLRITNCPKLMSSPEWMKNLTSLRKLTIWGFDGLSSLPNQIEYLTSLSQLRIFECPKLMSLPEGMKNLSMLRELYTSECPELEKRCKKERGGDWPKIAHIPNIWIEDKRIQSSET